MNPILFSILTFVLLAQNTYTFGQRSDSLELDLHTDHDTFFIIKENVPQSKLWGNCWHFAASYNRCLGNEFDVNMGRTYGSYFCSGGGCMYKTYSWGLGYALNSFESEYHHLAKVYYEHTFFYFPPISYGLRMEYFYDFNQNSSYIRPAIGLSFIYLDILYNYSLPLNTDDNMYNHGVTLRIKLFQKLSNWQYNHPNKC